jgi:hypothetical protein
MLHVPASMSLEVNLRIVGALLICAGVGHVALPRALGWREDLAQVSLLNRQVGTVHVFFIGLTCVLLGALPLLMPEELLGPGRLASAVLVVEAIFWGARLLVQLAVFDRSLWLGDRRRTLAHVAFSALWAYVTGVFVWALAAS